MNEIDEFFERHNFEEKLDIDKITNILLEDMNNGLKKNHEELSSMDMIPIWKSVAKENPRNKSVITIDAGGTNFRTALVKFSDEGVPKIHSFFKYKMPALDAPMTNKDFFDKLAEYLSPLKNQAEYISFCFSFAIKIYPDGSGEAIKLSKEIKLPEIAGTKINDELLKALKRDGWTSVKKIVMVNDTACVLQAGAIDSKPEDFAGFVGFVLGTGLNSAYIESGDIEKVKSEKNSFKIGSDYAIPKSQIIVCESGKCNKIPQSDFDKALSQRAKLPKEYFLERMCSGRYLGELCSIVLKTASEDSLFSENTKQEILQHRDFTTEEISLFLTRYKNTPLVGNNINSQYELSKNFIITDINDFKKIYILSKAVFTRASILSAAILASASIKMCMNKQRTRKPLCLSADGSVFLKGFEIKENIEKELIKYLRDKKDINFIIKTVENPVSLGATFFALN